MKESELIKEVAGMSLEIRGEGRSFDELRVVFVKIIAEYDRAKATLCGLEKAKNDYIRCMVETVTWHNGLRHGDRCFVDSIRFMDDEQEWVYEGASHGFLMLRRVGENGRPWKTAEHFDWQLCHHLVKA